MDKDFKPIINNEAGVAALTFYSGLAAHRKSRRARCQYLRLQRDPDGPPRRQSGLGIEWMAATQTLTDCTQSPKVCKTASRCLVIPLFLVTRNPMVTGVHGTGGSSWGWVIPSGSKNGQAAYKFIEWLTGPEGGKMWALNGGIPSNQLALTDPEVAQKIPQFKMLGDVMPIRHLVPSTTVTGDMVTAIDEAVVAAVTGTKDPKAALDEAAAKMTDMLTKAGYIK